MRSTKMLRYFLLPAILFWGLNTSAQDLRFGLQANPGFIWVSPDNSDIAGNGVRFSFDFGLMVDYTFGAEGRYAFNTGLNLLVAGGKIKGSQTDTSGMTLQSTVVARVNYLEVPLTIKLRSNPVGYFTFYGQLGMVPAFAVRSRANYSFETFKPGEGIVVMEEKNVKFDDIPAYPNTISKVKPVDIGLHTEAGFEYAITDATALVGGIYFSTGFMDMFKDGDNERIVRRGLGFRVGVLF